MVFTLIYLFLFQWCFVSLGSLQPCTCTVECGCVEHQGEGLGDDNGPVPNCPIDVKDVPKVRTIGLRATSILFQQVAIFVFTSNFFRFR